MSTLTCRGGRGKRGTRRKRFCPIFRMSRYASAPSFTLRGCLYGARLVLPVLPGVCVFASAFGTAAAQKGLTVWQALSMSSRGPVHAGWTGALR